MPVLNLTIVSLGPVSNHFLILAGFSLLRRLIRVSIVVVWAIVRNGVTLNSVYMPLICDLRLLVCTSHRTILLQLRIRIVRTSGVLVLQTVLVTGEYSPTLSTLV